jgi:hypothetical protein
METNVLYSSNGLAHLQKIVIYLFMYLEFLISGYPFTKSNNNVFIFFDIQFFLEFPITHCHCKMKLVNVLIQVRFLLDETNLLNQSTQQQEQHLSLAPKRDGPIHQNNVTCEQFFKACLRIQLNLC